MDAHKDAFVIMPFSSTATCTESQWTEIYENVFKPAIEDYGYSCERAMPKTGSLIKSIVDRLRHSRIVLADITDKNPNVFYELGVRHSLSKRTIIVTQDASHVPSDLRGYWFIQYGTSPGLVTQFKKDIGRLISEIESKPEQSDNPVSDYLEQEHSNIAGFINTENIKKLTALLTECTGNKIVLDDLLTNNSLDEVNNLASSIFISYDCLNLLLQSMYIDLGPEILKCAYELRNQLRQIEKGHVSRQILMDASNENIKFATNVLAVKMKLALGEYKEPSTVSTMVWKPSERPPLNTEVFWGKCGGEAISNFGPNVLLRELIQNAADARELRTILSPCEECEGTGKCSLCSNGDITNNAQACVRCRGTGSCLICKGSGAT